MKSYSIIILYGLLAIMTTIINADISFSANNVTLFGIVGDFDELITEDDEVYNIVKDQNGKKLIKNIGRKVKVTGNVEVDGDTDVKKIKVAKFELIEDEDEDELQEEEEDEE